MSSTSMGHGASWWLLAMVVATLALALPACKRQRPEPTSYTLQTDDARGLSRGAPVYVAGVQVGKVREVALAGRKAQIELALTALGSLSKGTCARIASYGMARPMHVELVVPERGQALPQGEVLTCVKSAGDAPQNVDEMLELATAILDSAATGKGVVGRLLRDEKLADKLEKWLSGAAPVPVAAKAREVDLDAEDAEAGPEDAAANPVAPVPPVVPGPAPQPFHRPPAQPPWPAPPKATGEVVAPF